MHRGLRVVTPDIFLACKHLEKAEHNLKATYFLYDSLYKDWCASTLFYTIYHCFLAILIKEGYESKNQECTFVVIENLINEERLNITHDDFSLICSLDELTLTTRTILSFREEYQYSVHLSINDDLYRSCSDIAKRILDISKEYVEE